MHFSPAIDPDFEAWLDNDTCFSGHPFDDARFYMFVRALVENGRPAAAAVAETIIEACQKMHPDWGRDYIEEEVQKFWSTIDHIYGYLDAPSLVG